MASSSSDRIESDDGFRCPQCRTGLAVVRGAGWRMFRCVPCGGVALTTATMRQLIPADRARELWQRMPEGRPGRPCPGCARPLTEVQVEGRELAIDVCRGCQLVWFDAKELDAFVPPSDTTPALAARRARLSPRASEALALARLDAAAKADDARSDAWVSTAVLEAVLELMVGLIH